jgi:hypothetical protein
MDHVSAPGPTNPLTRREYEMNPATPLEGIISHFAKIVRQNVHDHGIVTITSKSVADSKHAVRNLGDLSSKSPFISRDNSGQWVCWAFHVMIVPSHYTLRSKWLKSWMLEGSIDNLSWGVMDRRRNTDDFPKRLLRAEHTVTFVVLDPLPSRYFRLTQTDKNHNGDHTLILSAFEVFGQLESDVIDTGAEEDDYDHESSEHTIVIQSKPGVSGDLDQKVVTTDFRSDSSFLF